MTKKLTAVIFAFSFTLFAQSRVVPQPKPNNQLPHVKPASAANPICVVPNGTGGCAIYDTGSTLQVSGGRSLAVAGGVVGAGASMAAQLGDFKVERTTATTLRIGANCSDDTPCNVRFGSTVASFKSACTATISGGTGTGYVYITSAGTLVVGSNVTVTTSPTWCTAQSDTTTIPTNSVPLYSWTATSGTWDETGGRDLRAFLSHKTLTAGSGISLTTAGGDAVISMAFPVGIGDTLPATCSIGTQYFKTDAAAGQNLYFCTATNAWSQMTAGAPVTSPLTTKGDLFGRSTGDVRIPVGANGEVLTADSTQATGVKWAAAAAGGMTKMTYEDVLWIGGVDSSNTVRVGPGIGLPSTNAPGIQYQDSGAYRIPMASFGDGATDLTINFSTRLRSNYDGGNINIVMPRLAGSGSGSEKWNVRGACTADGGNIVAPTWPAGWTSVSGIVSGGFTTFTFANFERAGCAAGRPLTVQLVRALSDVADSFTGTLYVPYIAVVYDVNLK